MLPGVKCVCCCLGVRSGWVYSVIGGMMWVGPVCQRCLQHVVDLVTLGVVGVYFVFGHADSVGLFYVM